MIRNTGEIESMASLLILGGVIPLAAAIYAQHWLHLPPCHFCMLQRYPYVLVTLCGVLSLMRPKMSEAWRFSVALGLFGFVVTGVLGAIHTGIERGWLAYSGGCVAKTGVMSEDALREAILSAPLVSCKDALAQFGGLSMATWNALFALLMIAMVVAQYRYDRRKHG